MKKNQIVRCSDKKIKEYLSQVCTIGRDRAKTLGDKFSEVDFAMGASVFLLCAGKMDMIPSKFVFGPLSGKPIFKD